MWIDGFGVPMYDAQVGGNLVLALPPGLRITASVGVVTAPDAADLDGLSRHADTRLYAAKRAGRDRAVST